MYKLIFADDEALVRENLARIVDWESAGFKLVCCCSNGHELMEMVDNERPDLVITDINMPFISGIEASKQIRADNKHTKIVFLTGYDEFEYAQAAIELKVDKYILKPITVNKIMKSLSEIKSELDEEFTNSENLSRLKQFYEEHSEALQSSTSQDGRQVSPYQYLENARNYIAENYSNQKLSAKTVSDHLRISTSYFRSLFCKEFGMPFVKYLTLFRLEKSKQLLRVKSKKVFEIASETGFINSQYFCYCFKRHYDMTPLEMREVVISDRCSGNTENDKKEVEAVSKMPVCTNIND